MSNNKCDPNNPSSAENENESALHIFKDFLVLDIYESGKYTSSPNPHAGKNVNEMFKPHEAKSNKKINEIIKGNKKQGKQNENANVGERRDPEKTKRDIEKDKFNKKTEDIVKKLESGLVPPGMETELLAKSYSPKSLESLSATESISPKNANRPENLRETKGWNKKVGENSSFLFKHSRMKSPIGFSRSRSPKIFVPKRFQRSRTPTRILRSKWSKSPFRFSRSRSPNRFPRSRSPPNRFPRLRSPNRFPRLRSPDIIPRSRSPNRFQRPTQTRHSPFRQTHSRERESNNCRTPNRQVSRKRSTERFLKELIKTSGIQETRASPNLSQEFSNPNAPVMFPDFGPSIFPCGPPATGFPPFPHPGEMNPNMMPNDENNMYFPNDSDSLCYNFPPPSFPPASYPSFPPNIAPENPLYFPPPMMPQEPVGNNPANDKLRLLKEVVLQANNPELKTKNFPPNSKIKADIISRCQDAVLKLDSLHFPNRLFSPPEEHAIFYIHQSAKVSPLRRQLPPSFSFTTKPNDSGAILLPSIISTIGMDEILSSMALPPPSFTLTGQIKKDAYCQTDEYLCNYCQIRKHIPSLHKSTMTIRSSVSVHCQVTNDDLHNSKIIFMPNQSEAPLQEKPVSLMHMTPAQILVAELTAKAKSLQRSTVEAVHRAKQDQLGQSDSNADVPPGTGWMRDEQRDGDSYGYKRGQNQLQMGKWNNQDPEQGYKEDHGSGHKQGKGYAQMQGQRRMPRQGLLGYPGPGQSLNQGQSKGQMQGQGYSQAQGHNQGQSQGQMQGQGYSQGQEQGYNKDQTYGSGNSQSHSKLTREYDEFLQRIQSEKQTKHYGNRRNNAQH